MSVKYNLYGTAIGSLPQSDSAKAVEVILNNIPNAPIWPQLPALGMNEQMEVQYSEHMPGATIDREKERLYIATNSNEAMMEMGTDWFMAIEANDTEYFKISEEFSKGFYAMKDVLSKKSEKLPFVKVQVTGPCSFSLTIVDENKRAVYYNEMFRDVVVKTIAMKAKWQIQQYKNFADNVICFIDEPILSAFGSSTYVSVQREDVVNMLKEVIAAVHEEGAIAGIHCCGNTEWSILVDAGVDIINFDAFDFGETIFLYNDHIKTHLERGGCLAWGIVPTNSEKLAGVESDDLIVKWDALVEELSAKTGISKEKIYAQSLITPSCGTGSLPVADAEKAFRLDGEVSEKLRARAGF